MNSSSTPVTKQDVQDAVTILEESGEPVTIKSIRNALGRGSNSTIVKYQKQLSAEAQAKARLADPLQPPQEIFCMAGDLNDRLVRQVFEAGVTRGLVQVETLNDKIMSLEQETDELVSDLDAAVDKLRISENERTENEKSMESKIEEERRRVDAGRAELDSLRIKYEVYEKSASERIEELQRDLHTSSIECARKDVLIAKMKGRLLRDRDGGH